jgi:hypothetical protein
MDYALHALILRKGRITCFQGNFGSGSGGERDLHCQCYVACRIASGLPSRLYTPVKLPMSSLGRSDRGCCGYRVDIIMTPSCAVSLSRWSFSLDRWGSCTWLHCVRVETKRGYKRGNRARSSLDYSHNTMGKDQPTFFRFLSAYETIPTCVIKDLDMCLTRSTPVISHAQTPPRTTNRTWSSSAPFHSSASPPLFEALSSKGTGDPWFFSIATNYKICSHCLCSLRIGPGTLSRSISNRRQ